MSVLDRIFERKAQEVAAAKARIPLAQIKSQAADASPPRGFLKALQTSPKSPALIAEVKKASPSKGLIRPDFDPVAIARTYEEAGAAALSVLTDERYFQGSPENLIRAREATSLPCLRKDFVNDPYQVYEARAWGADAILLIVASLNQDLLMELLELAQELGMDALVEVHDEVEAQTALQAKATLIGVNNRNLADMTTTLETSDHLLPIIAPHALAVSESALENKQNIDRVANAGARAVLIGTSFCAAPDIASKVREVMGW